MVKLVKYQELTHKQEHDMSSENKKRKLKNSYQCKSGLKDKGKGIKGMSFYTSSERQRLKKCED
jgi:hypothetical protein